MAQGTPMPPRQEANHFEVTGEETTITYDTTSMTGTPRLSYEGPFGTLDFEGDEIATEMCAPLGRLVTVIVQQRPDADVTRLSMLLPEIHLLDGDQPTPFATLAIVTTDRTTIGGPGLIDGPLQSYEAVALDGTASIVQS